MHRIARSHRLAIAATVFAALMLPLVPAAEAQKSNDQAKNKPPPKQASAAKRAKSKTDKKRANKKAARASSPCQGLAMAACERNKDCGWIVPKKKIDTRGRKLTAYCRKVGGAAKTRKAPAKTKASATRQASKSTANSSKRTSPAKASSTTSGTTASKKAIGQK